MLGKRGIEVFGSVRKQADAESLGRELGKTFTPLLMDVTDGKAIEAAAALVAEKLPDIPCSAWYARIAGGGPLIPIEDSVKPWKSICLDHFKSPRHRSWAPIACGKAGPAESFKSPPSPASLLSLFLGSYVASKFALEGMSESLRRELLLYGST